MNKNKITQKKREIIPPSPFLRGRDLKDYKILPDFALIEKIADKKESIKTNIPQQVKNAEGTAMASPS